MFLTDVPQNIIDEMLTLFPKFVVDNDTKYEYTTLVQDAERPFPHFRPNYIVSVLAISQLIDTHLRSEHNLVITSLSIGEDLNLIHEIHDRVFSDPNVLEHYKKHHLMNGGT